MAPNRRTWAAMTQTPIHTDCKKPQAVCNRNLTVNQDSQVSGAMKNFRSEAG